MTDKPRAYNVVRFQVMPGREDEFLQAHREADTRFPGFLHGAIIKTGPQRFCFVGAWDSMQSLENARPQMIRVLDRFRGLLEDMESGTGVTDPVSGEVVLELPA